MSQLLNLPYAQPMVTDGGDELLDLLELHPVHAHELAQGVHVRVNGKGAAKELGPDGGAHLRDQPQPHAHPGFTPGEFLSDLRHSQISGGMQLVDKGCLLQDAQGPVIGNAQQAQDAGRFILSELLRRTQCTGNLIQDAHLAALATERGATLYSTDADFSRFPGLQWLNPLSA